MTNFVLPCYSNMPDRDHNTVVLGVDEALLELLGERMNRFDMDARADHGLLEDVYSADTVGLYYAHFRDDPGETLDYVDGPTELSKHLVDLSPTRRDDAAVVPQSGGCMVLTPIEGARLHIGHGGFWLEWDGLQNRHGPSEVYMTEPATLPEIQL